jgi:hypothetical protein
VAGHGHHHHAYGPTGVGTVVLDLGGDVGALIVHTPAEWHGEEIEISLVDAPAGARRTHSAVRERHAGGRVFHSAVYPDLPAGRYAVWHPDGRTVGTVTVSGGAVAEFVWPRTAAPTAGAAPA